MIDFYGMSTHLGLFYIQRLGNLIHCIFIFIIFWLVVSYEFFVHGSIEYKWLLNRSIRPIDGTVTGTITLGKSGNEVGSQHSLDLQN